MSLNNTNSLDIIGDDAPLKGVICYYSGSGNTKLACRYVQGIIKSVQFDLFNLDREYTPDLDAYDVAGFATFTDFSGPPHLVQAFLAKLKPQNNKPAFVLNTYSSFSGKTRYTLEKWVTARGFRVIAAHSLHTPESYPPMIAAGKTYEQAPNEKELAAFKNFVALLDEAFALLKQGKTIRRRMTAADVLAHLLPSLPRTLSRKDMGVKYVDEARCKECGACAKLCPHRAIRLGPKPIFDMTKCYGCWRCFNLCPNKAIYTRKYRGVGHYPGPIDTLKEKLKV